jgi:GAF domain-containing protein
VTERFLELLAAGASREDLDAVVAEALDAGVAPEDLDALHGAREAALRIHAQLERHRRRETEMTALYETASDLTAIRDVDAILTAIVRRARQLLRADMTYLSLNDEVEGASYMKVTDGALTAEFRDLRLPLGTGLLGLVAQTGAPYYTEDYQADERFVHRDYIDSAVAGEQIRAILGVPLVVEGTVIGALLAVHRTVRPFPPGEVSLLMSFAAHAAVALENARLFAQTQEALAELDAANRQIRAHSEAVELAAHAHDELTGVLLRGGGVADVAAVLADVLDGGVRIDDDLGRELARAGDRHAAPEDDALEAAVRQSRDSGRSVEVTSGDGGEGFAAYVVTARAGAEHLGTLVLTGRPGLGLAERRTLERGALVTALVLLFSRTAAQAEERLRGELLADLLGAGAVDPARLRERARLQGADLDRAGAVAVAAVDPGERHRAVGAAARLAAELGGLAGDHDGHVVLVAPGEDALVLGHRLQERVRAAGAGCTVGVATTAGGPEQLAAAHREARSCVETLTTLGREGEVSDPAGLGVATLLLGHNGPAEMRAFVDRTVGPVLDYDARRGTDLRGTLEAWYDAGERQADTAKRLHVHPNTVAQRLERLDQLLGPRWREPAHGLDIRLALRLLRLRDGSEPH